MDFFSAPYMIKFRFNQDLIPCNLTKETAGKDMIWQRTYGAYLIKLKKANYGEFFTDLEPDNQDSLVVPIDDTDLANAASASSSQPVMDEEEKKEEATG